MRGGLCSHLDEAIHRLTQPAIPTGEKQLERDALALQKLNVFCLADDAAWKSHSPWWQTCVATVTYLRTTLNRFDAAAWANDPAVQNLLPELATEMRSLSSAISAGEPWRGSWQPTEEQHAAAQRCGLSGVCQALIQLGKMDPDTPPAPAAKQPSMAADAWTNPAYIRYALKTLLACMVCYVFYSGVEWEGIHTCMLTCVIVANPSIGSSYQKMSLRFGGAFFGAIFALLFTLLVMPWLDNIVELLCVLAPIFLLGSWLATSSERSSYIGTQMVVTFALATLENVFGPCYDLVEIRDRALGILIGTAVSAVIYTFIWPESEAQSLPQKLAGALAMLAKAIRLPHTQGGAALTGYLQLRIGCHAAFNASEEMCERVALERHFSADERDRLVSHSEAVIRQGREMLYAWDKHPDAEHAAALADALDAYASGLAQNDKPCPSPMCSER